MNRTTRALLAGTALTIASLAGSSINANAVSGCVGSIAVPRATDPANTVPYLRDSGFPGTQLTQSALIPVSVPAGTYLVTAGSEDQDHAAGPSQETVDEPNEQWTAIFYAADGISFVAQTGLTPDLPFASVSATSALADVTFAAPASFVRYFHLSGGATRGSVGVSCLGLTASLYPPKPPTPGPTPTPLAPATFGVLGSSPAADPTVTTTTAAPKAIVAGESITAKTAVPVAAPALAEPGVKVSGNVAGGVVAFTGSEARTLGSIAALLTGAGALLLVATRKRRNSTR